MEREASKSAVQLPPIPSKQYFTISEVSELCDVKNHVLRYWEQEFPKLQPVKRRGNRRYYQHDDIVLIRQIRDLLYTQGFTISGARVKLDQDNEPPITEVESQSISNASDPKSSNTFSLNLQSHIEALESIIEILD